MGKQRQGARLSSRAPKAKAVVANTLPVVIEAEAVIDPVPVFTKSDHPSDKIYNSFAEAIGIGGGVNPYGYPGNQGSPWSAQVEQTTTIFRNLRWYMISNMRQVLNQAYVELGLVQTICDVPVDDALRGGLTIKSKQLDEAQLDELKTSIDRDDDLGTVGQAAKWNRLFGGAGVLILTDQDPMEPLDLSKITKDSEFKLRAVDMWELFWDKQNMEGYDLTIQEEEFEYYNYYGEQVHVSRVFRLKGLEAPSFVRPRLRGWGFSVVEILVRSINQYLKGTDLAFEVLDEFKIDVYKIKGLTQALASRQGIEAIQRRVQQANWQKNYQNALTMDSEDEWDHKQLSFAGLGDAMLQIRMQVAADMRMPLTKLFGISAAGFNSGEDDIEVYNAMVESQVRSKIKQTILRVLEIKCQQLFGFIPDDLSFTFQPLREMSSEQEQNVKTQQFTRLFQALQANAITLQEFREGVNKGELFDITLDVESPLLAGQTDEDEASDEGEDEDLNEPLDDEANKPFDAPLEAPSGKKPRSGQNGMPRTAKAQEGRPRSARRTVQNSRLIIMPKTFTTAQLARRALTNSATFDRKTYEAEGGDGWIDKRRELFFDRDKAQDAGLWDRAVTASHAALGEERWQFVVWFYKKQGGRFGLQNAWDESKHPRADDGKFGEGGGGSVSSIKTAAVRKKHPSLSGNAYHSEGTKDEATAQARALRKEGVHATILHMDGPRSGGKSKFYVMVPEKKAAKGGEGGGGKPAEGKFGEPIEKGQYRVSTPIRKRGESYYVDAQVSPGEDPATISAPDGYEIVKAEKTYAAKSGDYYKLRMREAK